MKTSDQDKDRGSNSGRAAAVLDRLDEAQRRSLYEEIEQALSGRIRDIALGGSLAKLYFETSWRQRSRVICGWLLSALILNVFMVIPDFIYLPVFSPPVLFMRLGFLTIVYLPLLWVWSRPRSTWLEGSTLPVAIIAMMIVGGILGLYGDEPTLYRYRTAGILAASTALVIFPVTLFWTAAGVVAAIACYIGFSLLDPMASIKDTIVFAIFLSLVLSCLVPARRSMNVLLQHAFALNLRSIIQGRALQRANAHLAVLATTDVLTGLPNRRAFQDEAARLWSDPSHPARSFGIVLFDIDHFKRLNDTAGHAVGDRCLTALAHAAQGIMPSGGMCARYGGEEFICIISDATPRGALLLSEELRAAIEALAWPNPGADGSVTVSIGLAVGATDRRPESLAGLICAADEALYRAKASGRNRVAAAWENSPDVAPAARSGVDRRSA